MNLFRHIEADSRRIARDGIPEARRVRSGRTFAGSDWFGFRANADYVVTGIRDPARFDTGFYRLRLTAVDVAGRTATTESFVELDADVKTGRFVRTETDFSTTIAGHVVDFTRRYDSQAAGAEGSFGFGWSLALREPLAP